LLEKLKRENQQVSLLTNTMSIGDKERELIDTPEASYAESYSIHRPDLKEFHNSRELRHSKAAMKREQQSLFDRYFQKLLTACDLTGNPLLDVEEIEIDGARIIRKKQLFVVFGAGDWTTTSGQKSPHIGLMKKLASRFERLGHLCVCINEYMTSQVCPQCLNHWGADAERIHQCRNCNETFNRDMASSQLMALLARGLVMFNQKPAIFQRARQNQNQ
jgi:transposase